MLKTKQDLIVYMNEEIQKKVDRREAKHQSRAYKDAARIDREIDTWLEIRRCINQGFLPDEI